MKDLINILLHPSSDIVTMAIEGEIVGGVVGIHRYAYVDGNLEVSISNHGYVITHLETGLKIADVDNIRQAKRFAEAFVQAYTDLEVNVWFDEKIGKWEYDWYFIGQCYKAAKEAINAK